MLTGINIDQRIEFTCQEDQDPKTVFIFRPLSGSDIMNLRSLPQKTKIGDYAIELLDMSIVEVVGVTDKRKFLKSLESHILDELVSKFNDINNVKDDDKKN